MISETLMDLCLGMLKATLNTFNLIGIPLDVIEPLTEIVGYGVWIIGLDLVTLALTVICTWWLIKFTVGLVVWLWELLPLT